MASSIAVLGSGIGIEVGNSAPLPLDTLSGTSVALSSKPRTSSRVMVFEKPATVLRSPLTPTSVPTAKKLNSIEYSTP